MIRVSNLAVVYGRGTPLEKRALKGVDLTRDLNRLDRESA